MSVPSNTGEPPADSAVLFSEGRMYRYTNEPLLRHLSKKIPVRYFTLDNNDPLLLNPIPNVFPQYFKPGLGTWFSLSRLRADLFITTTPGLNSLALKRSPDVKHYSYYMHSPCDLHWYQKYSFDSYDSICLSSNFQLKALDGIEKNRIYGFSYLKGERHVLGLPYYDHYAAEYQKAPAPAKEKVSVLIATNWGGNNYLNYLPYDIFAEFLNGGYEVIFRPHPQSFRADAALINGIISKYGDHPHFIFDRDINIIPSLRRADILVSAVSGIIFDFAFLTEKPSIVIDFQRGSQAKKVAFEGDFLPFKSWDEEVFYPEAGIGLKAEDASIVSKAGGLSAASYKKGIHALRGQIAHFGNAAPGIAAHYTSLMEGLNA